ncbi:MAG TPA: hypothetical protein VJW76_03005 [Verrucomicrobiae bacterium]|nr:hypothetical protein [Verrucomicrobiae bacterium]
MAKTIDTDSNGLVARWFGEIRGVSAETIARVRAKVEGKMNAGTCKNMMAMAPPEFLVSYELRACVEQVIREDWETLSAEERLSLCRHPYARLIGDQVRLPDHTTGTVVAQELTKRLGVLITVRLSDGTPSSWEFYE